jgi:hypothetical protein
VSLALLLTSARVARAGEAAESSPDTAPVTTQSGRPPALFGPRSGPPVEATLSVTRDFKTSFVAYPGSLTIDRVLLSVWAIGGVDPIFVKLQLDAESSNYGFQDARRLLEGTSDPAPETLWTVSAATKAYALLDPWTLYLAPIVSFCGALDAPVRDSLRYELDAAARYDVESDLKLTFGAGVKTKIEARPSFYPILGLEYGRLKLALEGATFKGSFDLLEAIPNVLEVRASVGYDYREFRLPHGSSLPEGVLRDGFVPIKAGLGWKPIPGLEADLDGGATVWRKLIIDDHLGRIVAKARTNPSALLAFQIVIDI